MIATLDSLFRDAPTHPAKREQVRRDRKRVYLPYAVSRILGAGANTISVGFKVRGSSFHMCVPDDQYFISVKDVLLNREYEYLPSFELANFANKRIVDAGAHVGLFSVLSSAFAKQVIAIEPHPINYRLLETNLIRNCIRNVVPVNCALWREAGRTAIYEGADSSSHSLLKNSSACYEVRAITLEQVVDEYGDIDLMKIDVEGAEFAIFERVQKDVLRRVKKMVIEIHLTMGDVGSIAGVLQNAQFNLSTFNVPLVKTDALYRVEVDDLLMLKVMRSVIYSLSSLFKVKDRTLMMMFASERRAQQLPCNADRSGQAYRVGMGRDVWGRGSRSRLPKGAQHRSNSGCGGSEALES